MKLSVRLHSLLFWLGAFECRRQCLVLWQCHMRGHPQRAENLAANKRGLLNALAEIRRHIAAPLAA